MSLIDKATDLLYGSVDALASAMALFMTGWFISKLIVEDGKITDDKENYESINDIDQAKDEFFTQSVVPFLAGISLVFFNIQNLNKKYIQSVEESNVDDIAEEIVDAINTVFGFNVTNENVEIDPNGWLANVGDLKSIYDKVRAAAMKAVTTRMPLVDFIKILRTEIEGNEIITSLVRAHLRTIVWDVYAEFDRNVSYKYALKLGYRAAIYEGGLIDHSRDFCIVRNGNVYTFDEISKFGTPDDTYEGYSDKSEGKFDGKPKYDYDPFLDQGGHNCRHAYSYIPDRLAIRLRPELKDVFAKDVEGTRRANQLVNLRALANA